MKQSMWGLTSQSTSFRSNLARNSPERGIRHSVHSMFTVASSFFTFVYLSLLANKSFSVLVTFKHFHDGLRKQGRKIVKGAFHFRDRGKNAWLYQIFECKVNTFILNFFS